MNDFILLKLLSHLMLPPASMVLGVLGGALAALAGLRRLGVGIALLSALETLILSVPLVSDELGAPLQQYARAESARAVPCCYAAIVILGGGSLRVLHGAQLYKIGIASRIIVSGGDLASDPTTSEPEAEYMKRLLVLLGVPSNAITAEDAARNTAENIANVKEIVGDAPVALVTSAYHMKRAMQLAKRGALNASAFPADYASSTSQHAVWDNWLPNLDALQMSAASLWEYLGINLDFRAVKPTPVLPGNEQRSVSNGSDASKG